jgi:Acyltransferase family
MFVTAPLCTGQLVDPAVVHAGWRRIDLAVGRKLCETARTLQAGRNTQLDGWRAFAVVGVMWLHWAPASWRGSLPFEIGLFFFLTLTGFLITRVLLRQRADGEAWNGPWRRAAVADFMKRRFARILVPCYAAMVFALAVGAPDIRSHPVAYFLHVSNWHIAFMPGWPSGTSHYWTLAIQMQFYLLWPLVVFLTPRRALGWVFGLAVWIAPVSRWIIDCHYRQIHHSEAITSSAMDYFGVGALLALSFARGMKPGDCRLRVRGALCVQRVWKNRSDRLLFSTIPAGHCVCRSDFGHTGGIFRSARPGARPPGCPACGASELRSLPAAHGGALVDRVVHSMVVASGMGGGPAAVAPGGFRAGFVGACLALLALAGRSASIQVEPACQRPDHMIDRSVRE